MKKLLVKYVPFLSHSLQYIKAFLDLIRPVRFYSQYKEDERIVEILRGLDYSDGIYIDVGANHPTVLSNTYHFYRKGYKGILIEPMEFFYKLNCKFRKHDTVVQLGISDEAQLKEFKYTKSHVQNTFDDVESTEVIKRVFIPVLPLDQIVRDLKLNNKIIFLLSIDVEGLDYKVLEGATELLKNTILVCIEANTTECEERINQFMLDKGFVFREKIKVNLIYTNSAYPTV